MKGRIIRFIRKAGRIIPISEKRMTRAITKAKVDAELTKGFVQREKKVIMQQDFILDGMNNRAAKKIQKLEGLKVKNDTHRKKLKSAAKKVGVGTAAGGSALGIYLSKRKK